MAQYDSLKDYIRLNHLDTIVEGANDYIRTSSNVKLRINDLKILTQGKIVFMPSDIIIQSEITFKPFDILNFILGISCEESDEDNNSAGIYYYNVMLRGNMSKRFSDLCVLAVEECTQESLISETITSMFGLPDIAVDNLEEEADRVHKSLYTSVKRNEEHRYRFEPVLIKEKFKKSDNMHMWPAELPEECLGQIRFEASSATIYDINDPCTPHPNYPIPANSILLNVKYYRNEIGCDDIITAAHELVHWEIHRDYMRLLQFLDDRYKVMECKTVPIPLDNNMSPKEKARWYAEWQANELAIRVAMPKHLVEGAIAEYNNDESVHNPADIPFSGMYYQNMIYKLSWDFNVPKEVMKIRLRQLGYDYADGTFVTVDDCIYQPFSFAKGTLKENETFVIDRDNYERLLHENEEFAELIDKRYFVYTGYVVCYNHPKYIKHKFSHDVTEYVLSDYAQEHADECCYKFKYTCTSNHNSFTEYTISQYLCKLDDIKLILTTDADDKGVSINAKQFKMIIYNNPDTARQLEHDGIEVARHIVSNFRNIEITDTMLMTLATAHILKRLGVVTDSDLRGIIRWFRTKATSKSTMTDAICRDFKSAVSGAILSGELKIAMQYGPPYFMSDGHTAFIAENDRSINIDEDVVKNVIISKLNTRSVVKMNKHINEKGLLKGKHTNKRKLKVAYDAGVLEDTEMFSYSRSVLSAEARAFVNDIIDNEYWFNVGDYPAGFVPVLYNKDGTRAAGYVFKPEQDDNPHEGYFGYTRSGKTFAMTNRSIQKVVVEGADAVIIFDQTGGFSTAEVDKHIGKELREQFFSLWNVYEDGVPVNLLDLRGCLSYKEKKERLTRIYAIMSRSLGSYQEQILKYAVKDMLFDMKNNPDITILDIKNYIVQYNDDGEIVLDEAHKKLRLKLMAVLDELEDMPQRKNNWGEFLKEQGKPIVVISTGADNVGKGSEIIDMMLENLYSYKQCYPDSRYTVVIDEAQDLYLHEKGAVNVLLRKGGKHRITMLLASQSFPDSNIQFGKVIGNCGRLRSYHPKADDLKRTAEYFNCGRDEVDSLKQGECYDKGPFWSRYRSENVITTLKGKTVTFKPAPDMNNNEKEDKEQS